MSQCHLADTRLREPGQTCFYVEMFLIRLKHDIKVGQISD